MAIKIDRLRKLGELASYALLVACMTLSCVPNAHATPWAEVGDAQLRSDIEVLASANVIDDITTQWPLPWRDIVSAINAKDATANPNPMVAAAARRVMATAGTQFLNKNANYSLSMDIDTTPEFVRGFAGMGREKFQGQMSADYVLGSTALRISVGAQFKSWNKSPDLLLDGSFIAHKFGPTLVYAGYMTHWWGPGWFSALSLSNNARPFPQIGIERIGTAPFKTPWLSWLGPWQAEFLVGILDDKRIVQNTLYNGLRITFNPLPGLQIGIARTEEFCGKGMVCQPLKTYFNFNNDPIHGTNNVNDEGVFDFQYSNIAWGLPYEFYGQVMNEDSNPITHSGTSHLIGASLWPRFGDLDARLTVEYADSVPTLNIFSFGDVLHGFAYTNFQYVDGMRYRGRTLGFSLDSDSRLASVQLSVVTPNAWRYSLTFHHARVSSSQAAAMGANILTTAPVYINLGEARVDIPLASAKIELAGRYQDDQLRPKSGPLFSGELALVLRR